MDADSSMVDNREGNTFGMNLFVPWDAPESVVDVSSAGVVPLRDLPDGMGLVGRQNHVTESRILQGRDPRSIRVLVPDGVGGIDSQMASGRNKPHDVATAGDGTDAEGG